jgi:ADP-ribose pyrophosphatase YjhB (NUDIX family)
MATLVEGDRIGKNAQLRVGCSAILWDETRTKLLLTRRSDNGKWCIPGGGMDAGEDVQECCAREMWEETGLVVEVGRLLGVYSSPHRLLEYADGNRWQVVIFNFEVMAVRGDLTLNEEVTEFGYFTWDEIQQLDIMQHHLERIADALAAHPLPLVK